MKYRASLFLLGPLAGCSPYALDNGDKLLVTFEPGVVFAPSTVVTVPAKELTESSCQDAGGAVVSVIGIAADGVPSEDSYVHLSLDSASDARLIPIGDAADASTGKLDLTLDEFGRACACVRPGMAPGKVTLKARSGVVEALGTVDIRERLVPVDGALALEVLAPEAYLTASMTSESCGANPAGTCLPGRARRSPIALTASAPQSGGNVPEDAIVALSTTKGWIAADGDCASEPRVAQVVITLKETIGNATLCLDDTGGSATVSAVSGTIKTTKTIDVAALPAAVVLTPSATSVKAGVNVVFTAFVRGCDGHGIAGLPVSMTIESGSLTFENAPNPIQITGTDGTVSMSGVATEGPIAVHASLSTVTGMDCATMIEVKP